MLSATSNNAHVSVGAVSPRAETETLRSRGRSHDSNREAMTPFFRKGHDARIRPWPKQRRPTEKPPAEPDVTASVIARGMTLVGDCRSEDTIWIEGRVEGGVKSGKAVVIAKGGVVVGDVIAHDAIISGRVRGGVTTASRVELKASSVVDGEIDTRKIAVEKGALINAALKRSSAGAGRRPDWRIH